MSDYFDDLPPRQLPPHLRGRPLPDAPTPGLGGRLDLRMHTEPAGDPQWMHLWFTRAPTEEERLGIAKAVVAHLAESNATDKSDTNT